MDQAKKFSDMVVMLERVSTSQRLVIVAGTVAETLYIHSTIQYGINPTWPCHCPMTFPNGHNYHRLPHRRRMIHPCIDAPVDTPAKAAPPVPLQVSPSSVQSTAGRRENSRRWHFALVYLRRDDRLLAGDDHFDLPRAG